MGKHNCGEALFEIYGNGDGARCFQCPKCGRILKVKEEKVLHTEWYDKDRSDFRSDLDQFMIDEAMRGRGTGKLKSFYADQDGWYTFIFENHSTMCTVPVGLYLGYFVKTEDGSVKLNPKLEEELNEKGNKDRN